RDTCHSRTFSTQSLVPRGTFPLVSCRRRGNPCGRVNARQRRRSMTDHRDHHRTTSQPPANHRSMVVAIFPPLGGEKKNHEKDVSWSEPLLFYLHPHTKQSETEVQKIMHMQKIANQLPDSFTDTKRVIKSYILDVNAPARVEIPDVKSNDKVTQESKVRLKHSTPVGFEDQILENKRKGIVLEGTQNVAPLEEEIDDINIEKTTFGFVVIVVYVDDLNIIGTNTELNEVVVHLKKEFEMKDLGKTKYCLGLQIEHMPNGILAHQSNYTEKALKRFNMDKAKSLSTPMVGRSLNVDNDPFRPCEEDEDVLGPKDLITDNQIEMKYVQSSNNSADLFTKALPTSFFKKHVHGIGMRHVQMT
nr:putative copia-like polyprotein [Tanacetum cinerariifolium]